MEFTLKTTLNVSAERLFKAWLNSASHSKMTGGGAEINAKIGSNFSAWDGYIEGQNLAIEPFKRIVQSWRTTEFDASDDDSQIEILLEELNGVTELTLIHTQLPEHGEQYKKGWQEHYFEPMRAFFE
ncbi:MAG: hypothetical protein Crog4KO_17460 [Crocinitomicaceae bacterium]